MAISRISIKDSSELRKIVIGDVSVVESGLTLVCEDMPIDSKTKIDLLCHDEGGQFVILKLSAKEDDNMFFAGLKILAHVNNIKSLLKFTYKDFKIDVDKSPRLIFVAPSFSPQLVDVVGQMQGIQTDLYTWEYFEFDGKRALHLETVWQSDASKAKARRSKSAKPKREKAAKDDEVQEEPEPVAEVVMPPEEIDQGSNTKEYKDRNKKKSIFSI
ncbi:MAG: hypothetical protein NWE78_03605 [Candidatus Bathyarchaeota archaeon]|nr:hypothetical protein [Candidatus Bathyarchaeota archaeon]